MKNVLKSIAVAGLVLTSVVAEASKGTGMSRPNAFSLEALGRGGLWSVNYDRSITSNLAVGAGFSSWSYTLFSTVNFTLIPVYLNLYTAEGPSRFMLTGGTTIVNATGTETGTTFGINSATGAFFTAGFGYEYRAQGGFLFRLNLPYIFFAAGVDPVVTGGLSLGFTF